MSGGRQRKCKYESLTIRQAQHKNFGLQAHLDLVQRILAQERRRRADDVERERRALAATLTRLRAVCPVPVDALAQLHTDRRQRLADATLHVVSCYMQRQEQNKEQWRHRVGMDVLPAERPVRTPDHLHFLQHAFPELNTVTLTDSWRPLQDKCNIYSRCHDMKCMSTKAKPTSGYKPPGPINFRFWAADDHASDRPDKRYARKQEVHIEASKPHKPTARQKKKKMALPKILVHNGSS